MAKLIYPMHQSLDGFVDHTAFRPDPVLFRRFYRICSRSGFVYGRRMYEVMRYWDDDHPEWDASEREYADIWRSKPKWVVSKTLTSVGPNVYLIRDDLEAAIRGLKTKYEGEMEVAGPELAYRMSELGLVDEYRIYLHPIVLGSGKPFFAGPMPPLRLQASERIGDQVIRLIYVPAS